MTSIWRIKKKKGLKEEEIMKIMNIIIQSKVEFKHKA